jgi:single-strand DNA-binding protein
MWRGLAEAAANVLKKGKLVYIEGKCRSHSFEDKAGIKRYITEIVADSFTLLGRNSDFGEESLETKGSAAGDLAGKTYNI